MTDVARCVSTYCKCYIISYITTHNWHPICYTQKDNNIKFYQHKNNKIIMIANTKTRPPI